MIANARWPRAQAGWLALRPRIDYHRTSSARSLLPRDRLPPGDACPGAIARRLLAALASPAVERLLEDPERLQPLLEDGLIDGVVRQLTSGKEAMVFVVSCGDEVRCAKVYKEANKRAFRQSVDYTENRKVRNSRQARAMAKGTRFGREAQEAAWQNAEVDALFRLAAAGVRVPTPYNFHEGVLLMELVTGDDGLAAPRLNDVTFDAEEARLHHRFLIDQVVRMLRAGVVHGDLSEFNILVGSAGPVIIDLPQAVDAAGNNHAQPHARARRRQPAQLFRPLCAGAARHRLRQRDLVALRRRRPAQPATS